MPKFTFRGKEKRNIKNVYAMDFLPIMRHVISDRESLQLYVHAVTVNQKPGYRSSKTRHPIFALIRMILLSSYKIHLGAFDSDSDFKPLVPTTE